MDYNNSFPANSTYQNVQPQQIGYTGYTPSYNAYMPNTLQYQQPIQNYNYQQQNQTQNQFNQIVDNRIRVSGIENAKVYPIGPNAVEILWDVDGKTFYFVTANSEPIVYEYYKKDSDIISNTFGKENNELNQITTKTIQYENTAEFVKVDDLENILNRLLDDKLSDLKSDVPVVEKVSKPRTMNKSAKGEK